MEICRGKNAFEDRFPTFGGVFGGTLEEDVLDAELTCAQHRTLWYVSIGERKREHSDGKPLLCA